MLELFGYYLQPFLPHHPRPASYTPTRYRTTHRHRGRGRGSKFWLAFWRPSLSMERCKSATAAELTLDCSSHTHSPATHTCRKALRKAVVLRQEATYVLNNLCRVRGRAQAVTLTFEHAITLAVVTLLHGTPLDAVMSLPIVLHAPSIAALLQRACAIRRTSSNQRDTRAGISARVNVCACAPAASVRPRACDVPGWNCGQYQRAKPLEGIE